MDLLDIAIVKQLTGGGGGSGTDNYNDLSNLPKINDTTLSGNKSSSALGLQSEITSENKIDSDLIDDTDQDNKFVTSTEKNTWNAKQNAIDSDHKLSSDLVDDANKTNKFVTSTEKNTWNAKQNAIDSDHKLSSSLVSFSTAEAAALASGIDSAKVGRISTNQTNILYGLNTGVKNKLPCKISNNNQSNDTGLKCNYNEDGTYTVTGTKSTSDSYLDIETIYADKLNGDHVAYISVTGTGTCQIAVYGWNGTRYTLMLSTSTSQEFNIGNYAHVLFRIRFMDSVGTSYNATVKAMVCTMEAWNQSHDWQPPALPNYDLTYREAEDRASLAEVVDSGAKNLFDLANATLTNISTTTHTKTASTLSVETTGVYGRVVTPLALKKGNYVFHAKISGYSPHTSANKAALGINSDTLGTDTVYGVALFTANGEYTIDFALTSDATVYIAFTANNTAYAVSPAESFVASEIMVCTKAAFGVSNKFVPYRPNYDLVCDNIVWNDINLSSSADLNTLFDKNTSWVSLSSAISSTIAHTPWTSGGFCVHNEAITSRAAIKSGAGGLFYQCLTPNNGDTIIMFRRKYDGSRGWDPWYKFDGGTQVN